MKNLVLLSAVLSFTAFAGAPAKTPELLAKGKTQFNTICAACHGEKGVGDGAAAAALNPKPRNFLVDPFKQGDKVEDIFKTATEGVKGTAMVGFASIPEEDRWGIAYYILDLRAAGKPAPAADAKPAAKPAAKKK